MRPRVGRAAEPRLQTADDADDDEKYDGADGRVDDFRDDAAADHDAELGQQPRADEGADDADDDVADHAEPPAPDQRPGEPSGHQANQAPQHHAVRLDPPH